MTIMVPCTQVEDVWGKNAIGQTHYAQGSPTAGPNSELQKDLLIAVFSDICASTSTQR